MPSQYPLDSVLIPADAVSSDDGTAVVYANIDVINDLFENYFNHDEISSDALRSYYVDYFLAQLNNGGFSQFVYNSRWGECIDYVTSGFEAMGANLHLDVFETAAKEMATPPGVEGLQKFFASDYFGENEERDILNKYNQRFFDLEKKENLEELNASWLLNLPNLVSLTPDEIKTEIRLRTQEIPDYDKRRTDALAAEPRYMKLIRALCEHAGHDLDRVTAGDPMNEHNGEKLVAWHFITNNGHHHMVDAKGTAIMFEGHTKDVVCEIDAGPEFGAE